ncbi:MAG: flagellar hook-basal body complex protein, partial [Gammaproteobacteria bacterium]|nr:flagellar hook-basal body complex protein [Gammaproteobacteria bacterium]
MPFRIALSGLHAASTDLKVTGNNIANSATTGFKKSRAEFVDVYASAYGAISAVTNGNGARTANIRQIFAQGNVEYTDNST